MSDTNIYNMQDNPNGTGGPFIPTVNMANIVPMPDDSTKVVTSHAALTADLEILAVANSKTAVRYWDSGVFKNGTPNTGDIIVFTDSVTTSGGVATFYPTTNHLSTGTALCSYISADSIQPNYRDTSGVYTPGAVVVASGNKSISQAFGKQVFAGLVVLGLNVLGSASNPSIPDGVTVKATWWGVSV